MLDKKDRFYKNFAEYSGVVIPTTLRRFPMEVPSSSSFFFFFFLYNIYIWGQIYGSS